MNKLSKTIKFDKTTGEFIRPTLLLEQRNGKRLGKVDYDNLTISFAANKIDEISFDVHKYQNGQKNKLWDKLQGLKIINYKDYGLFQANFTINENNTIIKTCIAQSLEVELAQKLLRDFHVNDEEAITVIDTNEKFQPTVFCNKDDPKHSLLHRILSEKAPHWSIGTVPDLLNVNSTIYQSTQCQRTFTIDSESIYDFLTGEVSKEFNVIFLFDTYNRQINCYNAEERIYNKNTLEVVEGGYELDGQYYAYDTNGNLIQLPHEDYGTLDSVGKDTHIMVTTNRLSQSFQLDENSDSIKNTFYISGGDDVITNFVAQANLTGKNYITIFSKLQYDDMSPELVQLIKQYNQLLESKEATFNKTGGVYLRNNEYVYNGNTAKNKTTGEITTDFRLDNQNNVYILDSCAYADNGNVYSRDDVLLTSGYILDDKEGLFTKYCHLNDRYHYLNSSKFPPTTLANTTATEQWNKLSQHFSNASNHVLVYNSCDTTSFKSTQNTIETMLKVVCDNRYTVKILSSADNTSEKQYNDPSLSNDIDDNTTTATWTATVRLTRETKPTDTCEGQLSVSVQKIKLNDIDTNNAYCKQRMDIAIAKMSIADLDFTNYSTEEQLLSFFNQYNLTTLKSYKDAFISCLSTLEDVYSNTMVVDIKTSPSSSYKELHDQYLLRANTCETIYKNREEQVNQIQSQLNACLSSIEKLRQDIDIESYIKNPQNGGSEELWLEYNMFIREDDYNNNNYISDGLSDAEILAKAKELLETAKKELKKACVAQKTISGSLNNIFTQRELEQLYDDFSLYNYVRCRVDDHYYKLRLLEFELHESNLSEPQCTFAENVEDVTGTIENIRSILEQASSMSTSYSSTVKQSKQGASALNNFTVWKKEGLDSAEYVIKNSTNEEIIIDNNGINCKSMNDIGFYGEHQCRLTGNGLYLTDTSWNSVRSAIGLIKFNGEWKYGIIADCIIGDFIVGKNVSVSNESGNVEITGDGIKIGGGSLYIANDEYSVEIDPNHQDKNTNSKYLFCVKKKSDDIPIMSVDTKGNGCFKGTIYATDGNFTGTIQSNDGVIGGWTIGELTLYAESFEEEGIKNKIELDSFNTMVQTSGYKGSVQLGGFLSPNELRFTDANSNYSVMYQGTFQKTINDNIDNIPVLCCSGNFFAGTIYSNNINTNDINSNNINATNIIFQNSKNITSGTITVNGVQDPVIYNNGSTYIDGNLYVSGTGVIKQRGDDSHNITIDWEYDSDLIARVDNIHIGSIEYKGHNMNTHEYTWTDSFNLNTGEGINLASVTYVKENFARKDSSDMRLKKDILSLNNIKDLYLQFKPKSYKYKDECVERNEQIHTGLLAQQVRQAFKNNGLEISNYDIVEEYQTRQYMDEGMYAKSTALRINYDNLHAYHIAFGQEIYKELKDENLELRNEIKEMKDMIKNLCK